MKPARPPFLGDLELAVMDHLWSNGGRDAKTVHGGLGITEAEFNIVANHLVDTLEQFKVPEKEKQELLSIVASLKPKIVESTAASQSGE